MKRQIRTGEDLVLPQALEAERGVASIALNNPKTVLGIMAERGFLASDIFDATSRSAVEVVLDLNAKGITPDARVIFERMRERVPEITFAALTDLYTVMPVEAALPELLAIVSSTAKRRTLMVVLHEAMGHIHKPDLSTVELVQDVAMKVDHIQTKLAPPKRMDTQSLLLDAVTRYETGDDQTQRIKTGYDKLDNLTPIRYGDFVVIGGETKSGKTMFALNIIANLITQ
jgi:replicative DNA helicase